MLRWWITEAEPRQYDIMMMILPPPPSILLMMTTEPKAKESLIAVVMIILIILTAVEVVMMMILHLSLSFSKFSNFGRFAATFRGATYDLAGSIGKRSIFGLDTTINR